MKSPEHPFPGTGLVGLHEIILYPLYFELRLFVGFKKAAPPVFKGLGHQEKKPWYGEVLYSTTCEYDPRSERGIRWDDPALAIAWPPLSPLLNERDRNFPLCADAENTFVYGE